MMLLKVIYTILVVVVGVFANTETYLLQIPYYYDVPESHLMLSSQQNPWFNRINETTAVIDYYPIGDANGYQTRGNAASQTVRVDSSRDESSSAQQLLVKLNNYNNTLLTSNDVLSVKLCWPATLPYDFKLSHRFIERDSLMGPSHLVANTLDIYVVIDYQANFVPVRGTDTTSIADLQFNLFINKLPNRWVPIPLELYDYIMYLCDVLILLAPHIPKFVRWVFY